MNICGCTAIIFKAVIEFVMPGFACRSGFHVKARLPFILDSVGGGDHSFTVPGVKEVAMRVTWLQS